MHELPSTINNDFIRYNSKKNNPSVISIFTAFFVYKGFRAVFLYRILRYSYVNNKKYLYYMTKMFDLLLNPIEISRRADIGPGFYIPHPQCIVIGGGKIGRNVSVFHGVTIGLKKELHEYPTIGDNVQIGAGSKILGKLAVGNNSRVAANAVVLNDVPDNSIAAGIPAKVIKENE